LVIQWHETTPIFVEIKAPSWRGELTPRADAGKSKLTPQQLSSVKERLRKPKDIHAETRWILLSAFESFNARLSILLVRWRAMIHRVYTLREANFHVY
jgi:hypothetical protein